MNNENKDSRKSRLVWDARIARTLCKRGLPIIDIKPYKDNADKTVFIFENTPQFQDALDEITELFRSKDEAEKLPKAEEYEQMAIDGWD